MTTHNSGSRPRRRWRRVAHLHGRRLGQTIPPLDELEDAIDKRVASGETEEEATTAVIEDFERSATTANARTTPLVPASGIVVAGSGILTKEGDAAAYLAFLAMAFAIAGLGFLAVALFTHAGRRNVGLPATRADVAFAHDRLTKKTSRAELGSFLSFIGFVILLIVIL
jgi:hypothetical protein